MIEKLQSEFQHLLPVIGEIDISKLPPVTQIILSEFLIPQNVNVPKEAMLVALNFKLSQILTHNRLKISNYSVGRDLPINYYSMVFMPSGSGKDRVPRLLDATIFSWYSEEFEKKTSEYVKAKLQKLQEEADDKFSEKAANGKQQFISDNKPRTLIREFGEATMEGMLALRESFADAGFGGATVQISEFADFILSENQARLDLISLTQNVYDFGDSPAKVIKGEKHTVAVNDVPNNILFHTSTSGLLEGKGHERLLKFLDRGLARRCFVCYPQVEKPQIDDVDAYLDAKDSAQKKSMRRMHAITAYLESVFDSFNLNDRLELDKEAKRRLDKYELFNTLRSPEKYQDEAYLAEIKSRHWKCLKLAGIIAAVEHPQVKKILISDIDFAIYQTELFGNHFQKFLAAKPLTLDKKLYQFFLDNIGKAVTKMDIREKQFIAPNYFKQWFEENIEYVKELARIDGYILIETKGARNTSLYTLAEKQKEIKVTVSASKDMTKDFQSHSINFETIHELANSDYNYSASRFTDNYRKKDNYISGNNLIILDIDDGWTIAEAKKFLQKRNLKACITTTKSHQVDKNGKIADRFRIFLPTETPFTGDVDEFSELMKAVHLYFESKPDPACKDASRFYFGNPNGSHEYLDGELFDIDQFQKPKLITKKSRIVGAMASDDVTNMRGWFIRNAQVGNRNNTLHRAYKWFSENLSAEEARREVEIINNSLAEPLDQKEINIICR